MTNYNRKTKRIQIGRNKLMKKVLRRIENGLMLLIILTVITTMLFSLVNTVGMITAYAYENLIDHYVDEKFITEYETEEMLVRHDIIDDYRFQEIFYEDNIPEEMLTNEVQDIYHMANEIALKPAVEQESVEEFLINKIGDKEIITEKAILTSYDLPDKYYPGIDYSSFQPWMSYKAITNKRSQAYAVCNSDKAYTDEYGLRRSKVTDDQFSVDGKDDYVIALGTYYKEKGVCGLRYLIVTSTGMYTAITGDEKADIHTDEMNMFSPHKGGKRAGLIEWIVDSNLDKSMKLSGTITTGPIPELQGEILYIYSIE